MIEPSNLTRNQSHRVTKDPKISNIFDSFSEPLAEEPKELTRPPTNKSKNNRSKRYRPDTYHFSERMPVEVHNLDLPERVNPLDSNMAFSVFTSKVKELNLLFVRPPRAGFVLYTKVNSIIYFGFGLDSTSHDLTDFGGNIVYKKDPNVIAGALRELDEETLSIFEPLTFEDVKECITIYDAGNMIIFIPVDLDPEIICMKFNDKYRRIAEQNRDNQSPKDLSPRGNTTDLDLPEVCGITWLTWTELKSCLKPGKFVLFNRLRQFLTRAGNFFPLL